MNHFHIKITLTQRGDVRDLVFTKRWGTCDSSEVISSKFSYENDHFSVSNKNDYLFKDSELLLFGEIRLYNRESICEELTIIPPPQTTDRGLVVLCYRQWGIACLNKLVGDFSFVLFDSNTQSLFAVRDHVGVKQLYYKVVADNLVSISSSIKDIMSAEIENHEEIDREILLDYLLGLLPDQNKTLFKSVLQLPPAHYFRFQQGSIQIHKYWNLKISTNPWFLSKKFHEKHFLSLFKKVLRGRWRGKKNILLFSGGLDSTSILCALRYLVHIDKNHVDLISHVNLQQNELVDGGDQEYIQIAMDKLGMRSTYTNTTHDEIDVATLMCYFDDNFCMPWSPLIAGVSPLELLYSEKSDMDIFSGIGGDEIVSLDPENKAVYLFMSGRLYSLYKLMKQEELSNGKSAFKNFQHNVLFPLLPRKFQEKYRKFRRVPVFDVIKNSFINPYHLSMKGIENYSRKKSGWWKKKRIFDPRKEIKISVESGYFNPALEHASAISRRSHCNFNMPFLDKRIIEFCLSVPAIEYIKDGVPRCFIRNCMRGYLPEKVENRSTKQLINHTDDVGMIFNKKLFWSIANKKETMAWTIIDREKMIAAYHDLQDGKVRKEDRPFLGYQISKCINVAAFFVWAEQKKT